MNKSTLMGIAVLGSFHMYGQGVTFDDFSHELSNIYKQTTALKKKVDDTVFWCKFRMLPAYVKTCINTKLKDQVKDQWIIIKTHLKNLVDTIGADGLKNPHVSDGLQRLKNEMNNTETFLRKHRLL